MLTQRVLKGCHQVSQAFLLHGRDRPIPERPLPKERVGALLDGVDLELLVQPQRLRGGAQERQQRLGQRGGGSVEGCQRADANVRSWGTSSLRILGVSSTSRTAHEADDWSSEMLEPRTALESLSSRRGGLQQLHQRRGHAPLRRGQGAAGADRRRGAAPAERSARGPAPADQIQHGRRGPAHLAPHGSRRAEAPTGHGGPRGHRPAGAPTALVDRRTVTPLGPARGNTAPPSTTSPSTPSPPKGRLARLVSPGRRSTARRAYFTYPARLIWANTVGRSKKSQSSTT
jgi:hypothetical protein